MVTKVYLKSKYKLAIAFSKRLKNASMNNTYSRRLFIVATITPMLTILISPFPHLLLMLQLLHEMIYVPRLHPFFFLWLVVLLLHS